MSDKSINVRVAQDADEPKFEFEAVDAGLIPTRARKY